jgi:signal transduction histidine kinase
MTFRTRVALALALGAIVPLAVLGLGVRREMKTRLDAQAARRVEALVGVLRADLAAETSSLRSRLRTLGAGLAADTRFRLATREGADRRWLLDWAGESMRASGLAVLRVVDSGGRILSSGEFRNEYDRLDPGSAAAIAGAAHQGALARFPTPDGGVLVLAAADSFTVADRRYRLIGGVAFDAARAAALVPPEEMTVTLELGEPVPEAAAPAAMITLPYYDATTAGNVGAARLVITRNLADQLALQRNVDRWVAGAAALTLLLAVTLAVWLASRVSRPLAELARKTSRLDLDRLDEDFSSDRGDEIGALGNLLAGMTARLRASTARLLEAERRAATGDLARQINHDVKNGLAPIRHVLRHLAETAAKQPEQLATVFGERRETLESSLSYLEDLARNYARLAPAVDRGPADLGALLGQVARASRKDGVELELHAPGNLPPVRADAVALRRIVENLVSNALDALDGRPGRVTLSSEAARNGAEPVVRFSVADTGRGMTRAELDRAFDDFHTTKASGTGLGLSVVRRLVGDLGGTLRVETRPGEGSTFTVELPAA